MTARSATAELDPLVDRVLETPVRLLRVVRAWPDGDHRPGLALACRVAISGSVSLITLTSVVYIATAEYDNVVSAASSVVDVVAGGVILFKIHCLFSHGQELLAMRSLLQHAFRPLEEKLAPSEAREASALCVDEARRICRWILVFYAAPSVSGIGMVVVNGVLSREERQLFIKAPVFVTRSDLLFWVIECCTLVLLTTFVFISGGFDTMFLSLCMHMRNKCRILQKLFRHACQRGAGPGLVGEYEYWGHDGSDVGPPPTLATVRAGTEVEAALRECALYHQLIVRLRDTTEVVYSNVSLVLMAYLLLGLGIPALRALYDDTMDMTAFMFLMMYTTWNFSQLLFYCWFADTVARSSQEVSVAAYSALRPDLPAGAGPLTGLTNGAAATLNLVTLRAQRPLHLTAGRFVALTLELYLEIMRRSQSTYSYLLNLR